MTTKKELLEKISSLDENINNLNYRIHKLENPAPVKLGESIKNKDGKSIVCVDIRHIPYIDSNERVDYCVFVDSNENKYDLSFSEIKELK